MWDIVNREKRKKIKVLNFKSGDNENNNNMVGDEKKKKNITLIS